MSIHLPPQLLLCLSLFGLEREEGAERNRKCGVGREGEADHLARKLATVGRHRCSGVFAGPNYRLEEPEDDWILSYGRLLVPQNSSQEIIYVGDAQPM